MCILQEQTAMCTQHYQRRDEEFFKSLEAQRMASVLKRTEQLMSRAFLHHTLLVCVVASASTSSIVRIVTGKHCIGFTSIA